MGALVWAPRRAGEEFQRAGGGSNRGVIGFEKREAAARREARWLGRIPAALVQHTGWPRGRSQDGFSEDAAGVTGAAHRMCEIEHVSQMVADGGRTVFCDQSSGGPHSRGAAKKDAQGDPKALPEAELCRKKGDAEVADDADGPVVPEGEHAGVLRVGDGQGWQAVTGAPGVDFAHFRGVVGPDGEDLHGAAGAQPVLDAHEHERDGLADAEGILGGAGEGECAVQIDADPPAASIARITEVGVVEMGVSERHFQWNRSSFRLPAGRLRKRALTSGGSEWAQES